jgi:hypothetical protein
MGMNILAIDKIDLPLNARFSFLFYINRSKFFRIG